MKGHAASASTATESTPASWGVLVGATPHAEAGSLPTLDSPHESATMSVSSLGEEPSVCFASRVPAELVRK